MQGRCPCPCPAYQPRHQSNSSANQASINPASDLPSPVGQLAGWIAYRNPNGLQFAPQLSAPVRKPNSPPEQPEPYSQRRTSSHFSLLELSLSRFMKVRTAHRQMSCETHKGSAAAPRYWSLQRKLPASHLRIHSGSPLFSLPTAASSKQHCKRSQYDSSARTRAASAVVQSLML